MPNPLNNTHQEQWDYCQRCGFEYPDSELQFQDGEHAGVKVCSKCKDKTDVEKTDNHIARILGHNRYENVDRRTLRDPFRSVLHEDW